MKERRLSGATHSFRLSRDAADIVDSINHPRRLGGKSRKVSDAIEFYFSRSEDMESMAEMQQSRRFWVHKYNSLVIDVEALTAQLAKKLEREAPPPPWWHRFFRFSTK